MRILRQRLYSSRFEETRLFSIDGSSSCLKIKKFSRQEFLQKLFVSAATARGMLNANIAKTTPITPMVTKTSTNSMGAKVTTQITGRANNKELAQNYLMQHGQNGQAAKFADLTAEQQAEFKNLMKSGNSGGEFTQVRGQKKGLATGSRTETAGTVKEGGFLGLGGKEKTVYKQGATVQENTNTAFRQTSQDVKNMNVNELQQNVKNEHPKMSDSKVSDKVAKTRADQKKEMVNNMNAQNQQQVQIAKQQPNNNANNTQPQPNNNAQNQQQNEGMGMGTKLALGAGALGTAYVGYNTLSGNWGNDKNN